MSKHEMSVTVERLKAHLLVAAKDPVRPILEAVAVFGNDSGAILVSTDSYAMLVTSDSLTAVNLIDSMEIADKRPQQEALFSRDCIEKALKWYTTIKAPKNNRDMDPVLCWGGIEKPYIVVGTGGDRATFVSDTEGDFPTIHQLFPTRGSLHSGGGNYTVNAQQIERIGKVGTTLSSKSAPLAWSLVGSEKGNTQKPVIWAFHRNEDALPTLHGLMLQMGYRTSDGHMTLQGHNLTTTTSILQTQVDQLVEELNTITKGDYSRLPVDEFRAFWHNLEFADSDDDDMAVAG